MRTQPLHCSTPAGTPTAPGTPTLTNQLAFDTNPQRLKVDFTTPAANDDNAGKPQLERGRNWLLFVA